MTTKYAVIIFVIGYCLDFVAALYKILHWKGADLLLLVSTFTKITGAFLLTYKLLTHPRLKNFLNS